MNNPNYNATPLNATCPACGMLCDDISLGTASELTLQNGSAIACNKGIRFFERSAKTSVSTVPAVAGKQTDLESAISAAASILRNSKQPLFAGLGTEVQGMRAIMKLAEKTNGILDHMHSEATVSNTRTMQNSGWLTTTLSEVKNRADVILAIGTDITGSHPRFFEKLVQNHDSLFHKPSPEVIYLGVTPETPAGSVIACDTAKLPEFINALNALLNGKELHTETVAGVPVKILSDLLEKLKNAKYAVIVWSASALKIAHTELVVQSIVQLIAKLNENSRAAGLPLNSGDGDTSVNNTSTWLSGYPTRTRFNNAVPEYDTYHNTTQKQLASCDALLWISTFNPYAAPNCKAPTIVIGHPDTPFESMPDVFIPVGIPGFDHAGQMFRMDSSITLPLKKLRDSGLHSLSEIITMIETKLAVETAA